MRPKSKSKFKWLPRYWATIKMSDTYTLTLSDTYYTPHDVWQYIYTNLTPLNNHWCITIMRGDVVHVQRWVHDCELLTKEEYYG